MAVRERYGRARESFGAWARRHARKIVVAVLGTTVVLVGIVMLVTPGPGLLAMWVGLSILAAEFAWARRWLKKTKQAWGRATGASGGFWGRLRRKWGRRDPACEDAPVATPPQPRSEPPPDP